jgi:hypothetical protein
MKNFKIEILLIAQTAIYVFVILFFDGTGDSGDSIMHYLYAKHSFEYAELFLNHWAKPVFVLLASPFAQFGFFGIKVFNALVMLLTTYFTFKAIEKLNISNSIVGSIILLFSPFAFVLTFSGLTEPLFALFLIVGIYLILSNQLIASCLIVSFLPFVRSEGLILLGIVGLYLILNRKWKLLPLLMFGHSIYSIAGYYIYGDLLWIFTKIPYAKLSSAYGSGKLSHFVVQMYYVVGLPIYILFWFGIIAVIRDFFNKKIIVDFMVLIIFGFFSFFIAHTLFWYLGIFNSMGLKRVLISVIPLSSIISLLGFNFLSEYFEKVKIFKLFIQFSIVLIIILFPFTSNPAAIKWKSDLSLSIDQKLANQCSAFIDEFNNNDKCFFYAHPYLSESLNINHFDSNKRKDLNKDLMDYLKTGDIVIWENWFSVVEFGISKEYLDSNKKLINIYNLSDRDKGREVLYSVYVCI